MIKITLKKYLSGVLAALFIIGFPYMLNAQEKTVSDATSDCLACHSEIHSGITRDWEKGRHSSVSPRSASGVEEMSRKITAKDIPNALQDVVVGCAECHTLRPEAHADTFEHNGYEVHVVVTPDDCAVCHAEEAGQYTKNIMSHAYGNLARNPVYQQLEAGIIGKIRRENKTISFDPPDEGAKAEACYHCHGTKLSVSGTETRETELAGELSFPVIQGWPNQGVGRINPDQSKGSCTSCHTRHAFSMELARKPDACMECHIGPDVPAYKVYSASKHGNIYSALGHSWNFTPATWTVGKDFTAPTCAACHISQIAAEGKGMVSKRTHQMNDRLPWRIFGLIYAHPHPKEPDTTVIRNASGLPLPTDLDGTVAQGHLIDKNEMEQRKNTMEGLCLNCHDTSWVNAFWQRFEHSIARANQDVLSATLIMEDIWKKGYAQGIDKKQNPFDQAIEKKWTDVWQFYANTMRFSSAMAGGGDYSVYAGGRYQLAQSLLELHDWLQQQDQIQLQFKR
ncbi:MAG: hydroxylamine oxidase [Desulfobacteraceae bacterium]|nr:hydroxylamine oxidase [Desulfobacteraceae bacterium]